MYSLFLTYTYFRVIFFKKREIVFEQPPPIFFGLLAVVEKEAIARE